MGEREKLETNGGLLSGVKTHRNRPFFLRHSITAKTLQFLKKCHIINKRPARIFNKL